MKKSPEQLNIENTMAHVSKLQNHAQEVAADRDIVPEHTALYVDGSYDSFDVAYDKDSHATTFALDRFKSRVSNIALNLVNQPVLFGDSARVSIAPLEGDTTQSMFLRRSPARKYFQPNEFSVGVYDKPRLDPSDPDVHVYGRSVFSSQHTGLGDPIKDEERIGSFLDRVQSLTFDQLVIPEGQPISPELNDKLLQQDKKSLDAIFAKRGIRLANNREQQDVYFRVGQENPIDVNINYTPYNVNRNGKPVFTPMARMRASAPVNGEIAQLSYSVILSDAEFKAGVSADVHRAGDDRMKDHVLITNPEELKYLSEILASIGKNADKGMTRSSFFDETYDVEKFLLPAVELPDGIDLGVVIASLYDTDK